MLTCEWPWGTHPFIHRLSFYHFYCVLNLSFNILLCWEMNCWKFECGQYIKDKAVLKMCSRVFDNMRKTLVPVQHGIKVFKRILLFLPMVSPSFYVHELWKDSSFFFCFFFVMLNLHLKLKLWGGQQQGCPTRMQQLKKCCWSESSWLVAPPIHCSMCPTPPMFSLFWPKWLKNCWRILQLWPWCSL